MPLVSLKSVRYNKCQMFVAGVEGAIWSTSYISPQMMRATNGRRVSVDLLANDMWAMGVVLVCLLAGYLIFGINGEDGPDLLAKCCDEQTLQDVAMAKLLQWVSRQSVVHASMRPCKVAAQ